VNRRRTYRRLHYETLKRMREYDITHHWEAYASEWTSWARTPDHDEYWSYRDQFREFVPTPGTATLEVGCGEGRVSRDLTALGHHVTAVDLSPSLVAAAQEAGSAGRCYVADAANLPFADNAFDCVIAYNMLMDVPDMPAVINEAARVLSPGGHLVISIVHPFTDRGAFRDSDPAVFETRDDYFTTSSFAVIEQRANLKMHFAGWSRPLRDYTQALEDAGLLITALREPQPTGPIASPDLDKWKRLPLFLWLRAIAHQ
jgi:SAM-dependent methyltransferase